MVVSVSHPIDASDTREGRMPMSFRFSLQAVQAESRREWIELVKRTDGAGFDMLVTADHLDGCLSPFSPLATAAEVSDRLRLGVLVLNNDFYSPSVLAREAATLDLLSDGRVEIGLGAGHAKPEYDRAGITFDSAPTRVDRLEEAVVILRRLFDREVVTFSGRHYRLVEERCDPAPLQAHLPLLVGGGGRRVLGITPMLWGSRVSDEPLRMASTTIRTGSARKQSTRLSTGFAPKLGVGSDRWSSKLWYKRSSSPTTLAAWRPTSHRSRCRHSAPTTF